MRASSWTRWALVLGIALGGFFDGILLHQILQWHHLLSLVSGMDDLRLQVLWDGYFHALMYLVAVLGLWGLWRARRQGGVGSGRALAAGLLTGFGLWHIADAVLSHWLIALHRVRLDTPDPLLWDLIWFAGFGLLPVIAGWLPRGRGTAGRAMPGAVSILLLLTAATTGAGVWAMQPPTDVRTTTIVFRPDVTPRQVYDALAEMDAGLLWTDRAMGVIVVDVAPARKWTFYRHGALLVSGASVPGGCFNWSRI